MSGESKAYKGNKVCRGSKESLVKEVYPENEVYRVLGVDKAFRVYKVCKESRVKEVSRENKVQQARGVKRLIQQM